MSKLLPVIHAVSSEQCIRNALLARENGADGCFLINHSILCVDLEEIYHQVRQYLGGDWWIGLNFLDLEAVSAVKLLPKFAQGLWVDSMEGLPPPHQVPAMTFGSCAFKYQPVVKDVGKAAEEAIMNCDVVTTSGDATGSPPTLEKIQTMKEAIGIKPLAIASGIDASNVTQFKPYVDYFLVATSIGKTFTELDPDKVRELADLIHV